MSAGTPLAKIFPEQGPPLSVPLTFFLTGPVALACAGALLLLHPSDGRDSIWAPSNVALVHLGAVGFLLFAMLGALYQLLPVVVAAQVPAARLAHLVHALLALGAAALVWGQATSAFLAFPLALVLLSAGLMVFLLPAGGAGLLSSVGGPTAWGIRLALLSLVALATLGLRLVLLRAGVAYSGQWLTLRWAHAHLGLLCWVGGLISAVSWQVLPMFFFVASPPRALAWGVTTGVAATLVLLASLVVFDAPPGLVPWAALPGACAVWLVQPAWALLALRHRKRKRRDPTLYAWWFAACAAPLCFLLGACSAFLDAPQWPLAYGLLAVWGWASVLVHGMLTRIVPFLVWLHWCAPRVEQFRMRSAKDLLKGSEVTAGFALHVSSVFTGLFAVWSANATAWRIFGGTLLLTGMMLAWEILITLHRGRTPLGARVIVPPTAI